MASPGSEPHSARNVLSFLSREVGVSYSHLSIEGSTYLWCFFSQHLFEVRVFIERQGLRGRGCDSGRQALCEEGLMPQPSHRPTEKGVSLSWSQRGG